jgi:hypothetical protein
MIFFLLYANKFPLNFQTFHVHSLNRQEGQQKKRESTHIYTAECVVKQMYLNYTTKEEKHICTLSTIILYYNQLYTNMY